MKAKETIDLVNKAVLGETEIPYDAIVLDTKLMIEVFTKKRLEIIEMINKIKPKSIQELATILQRKKQAVDRDIKILERFDIIELKKEGRNVIPIIKRKILVLPLVKGLEISNPEKKEYAVA